MISNRDKSELGIYPNYITNGGGESGTAGWSGYNDTQTFTVTIASPAVFTVGSTTNFYAGMPIAFTTTGALPTGLTAGTTYYISTVVSSTTFRVSATLGGSDVNTSGSQSGTHTARTLVPLDGTGGSLSGLTFSSSTSSPLIGNEMLQLVQTNSTVVAGQGISYSFTIDSAYQAQVLSIVFSFNASSTFSASSGQTGSESDLEIFIYDVTNAILIPVSPKVITANGSNNFQFKGIFQTASNSTSYRLCIHTATTNSNATGWTFKWDGVYVGPQPIVQGPPVTDFTTYTLTIGGTTSAPTPGTTAVNQAQWARVGDRAFIKYQFSQTGAGSAGSGTYLFPIPSGLTIDSSKTEFASTNSNRTTAINLGSASSFDGTTVQFGVVAAYNSTNLALYVGTAANSVSNTVVPLSNATARYGFTALVPITGWSSTTLMSNDASTRVVSARASGTPSSTSAGNIVIFGTTDFDTHGAYNSSTGRYTCPVSGIYKVTSFWNQTTASNQIIIYRNGSTSGFSIGATQTNGLGSGSGNVQCSAGDLLDVRPQSSTGGWSAGSFVSFELCLGPSNIAALDSINARYYASSTSLSGSLATIVWTTKDYDSMNNMSSGVYTIQVSGKYQINTALYVSGTFALGNNLILEVQKNSSVVSRYTNVAGGAVGNMKAIIADQISCLAGDLIRVQASSSGTGPAIVSSNFDNYISLFRTGN